MDQQRSLDDPAAARIILITAGAAPALLSATLEAVHGCGFREPAVRRLSERSLTVRQIEIASTQDSAIPGLQSALDDLRGPNCDIVLIPHPLEPTSRRLVVMDMDSTLILEEGIDELAREAGCYDQVSDVTARAMAGELDFDQALRDRCALLAGTPTSVYGDVLNRLTVRRGARRLMRALQSLGWPTAIVSGGFAPFVASLARDLGITYHLANQLESAGARLTGRLSGPIVNADRKAAFLEEIRLKERLPARQTIAVGDGANDLPMLGRAGLGVAFQAKPSVRRRAPHFLSLSERLDSVLYLVGFSDAEIDGLLEDVPSG